MCVAYCNSTYVATLYFSMKCTIPSSAATADDDDDMSGRLAGAFITDGRASDGTSAMASPPHVKREAIKNKRCRLHGRENGYDDSALNAVIRRRAAIGRERKTGTATPHIPNTWSRLERASVSVSFVPFAADRSLAVAFRCTALKRRPSGERYLRAGS